jgi:hypothetical protein
MVVRYPVSTTPDFKIPLYRILLRINHNVTIFAIFVGIPSHPISEAVMAGLPDSHA